MWLSTRVLVLVVDRPLGERRFLVEGAFIAGEERASRRGAFAPRPKRWAAVAAGDYGVRLDRLLSQADSGLDSEKGGKAGRVPPSSTPRSG